MANYADDKTYNKEMWLIIRTTMHRYKGKWLIIRTSRQHIQQRDVANYTDDNTQNKGKWLIIRTSRQHIQQRDVANYTDDKTINATKRGG